MTRAETGEARFPILSGLSTANCLYELAVVAVSYFGLTEAALLLPALNAASTPVWPPTGVALSLVLLRGNRVWPAILAGSFCAIAISPGPTTLFESASTAVATTVAALSGAWLIKHWVHGHDRFASPLNVAKFVLIAFAPTAIISSGLALLGPGVANALGFADPVAVSIVTWPKWWLMDATGIVITAPVTLLWATTPFSKSSAVEAAAVVVVAGAIGMAAYGPAIGGELSEVLPNRDLIGFLILLPLMWAGLRGNQRDSASAVLVFCGLAGWGLSTGANALPAAESSGAFLLLFALSTSTSVASLILGAAIASHGDATAHLLSAQRLLSIQLDQTQLAFKNAKRHFQLFIEGVADYAIFLLDTSGRITSWSSTAQKVIGYKMDEIVGEHFGVLYRPDERRAGEPNRAIELAIQKGKHEVEGWRVRKNGAPFYVTGVLTAIRDDDRKLIGLANIIRDATEGRDAQEKLVEAREQLAMAQKMEAIGKLTGGIAHDFNNLLMIIGGNAETFRRLLDPKLPRALEAIQTAAKRGEGLTRQLLTFSRSQHLSPRVLDLTASIRNMRTLIESSLRGNLVYNEKIEPDIWPVKVDLAELELAIVNIAVNSRDAMPNGGVFTLTAGNIKANDGRLGEQGNEELVALEFSDTGMGIPPALLSKIFDPFFTTKEVGKGTGLGLSQVYGFAHQAGGFVRAASKVGHGTAISVYLPRCTGDDLVQEETSTIDATHSQRPVVLVVDDSVEVAEVTSSLFEHLGYDTVYRDSAEAALQFLAEGANIDLIFSDIVMPGTIDGVGLASEVPARYPNLQVILTTGYSDAARATPPDLRILHKPFNTKALRNLLQETMGSRLASE
jgi:PAS domain S-box-containing protein